MKSISVFEKVTHSRAFLKDFLKEIVAVYEYDKTEIIEFLKE